MARYPSISPDGSNITFSCFGDIWKVDREGGRAYRLTSSEAYESKSLWSPDGKWIAFESDEFGNHDIYIVPVSESLPPRRLTFYSGYESLLSWTEDSEGLLFGSSRNSMLRKIYFQRINGGNPSSFLDYPAVSLNFKGGDTVFFTTGNTSWWRKKYRGPGNRDIWMKDMKNDACVKLTDFDGRDAYPMYSGASGRIYFLSNRGDKNINNIWSMNLKGEDFKKITDFNEEIVHPSISKNGKYIVFISMGSLWVLDTEDNKTEKIPVKVSLSYRNPEIDFEKFTSNVTEFRISPDENEIAFVVHGDVFVAKIDKNDRIDQIKQVTDNPFPDKDIRWHPSQEIIVYSSLIDGDFDLYTVRPERESNFYEDYSFVREKLLETTETEYKPQYSPDGKYISFLEGSGKLKVMESDGGDILSLTEESDVLWVDWSPDSRWLAFSRTALEWREDIYIVRSDGSNGPYNLSNHPNDDFKPMWSEDGSRIAFGSRDNTGNLWIKYIFLREEDEEREREYWKENMDSLKCPEVIDIDLEDFDERIHTVTRVRGGYNYLAQSPDGFRFAIEAENLNSNDIWTVDWFGNELKRLTFGGIDPEQLIVSDSKDKVYYLTDAGNLGLGKISESSSNKINFSVKIKIDRTLEKKALFDQAWWIINNGFYDAEFHGVNWEAMRDKYRPLAEKARMDETFQSVIEMMLGELNASHLGIWKSGGEDIETGRMGIIPDDRFDGEGVKIKSIIPGGPAERNDVNLEPGEIIKEIDDNVIGNDNYFKHLQDKVDKKIYLKTDRKEVTLKTVSTGRISWLIQKDWEKRNREWVEEESGGRIGYIYIASMGDYNLKKFEHDLYREKNKEGIIIDVRFNGGGHIHDELLNLLSRETYGYSEERGDDRTPVPAFKWDGPSVLLINQYCFSDAEIFPMGFRELKLGTVIGTPTFGGVIGTSNLKLMDGTVFREPGTGWYRKNNVNLENNPVYPDILVENPPGTSGDVPDRQLREALKVIKEKI